MNKAKRKELAAQNKSDAAHFAAQYENIIRLQGPLPWAVKALAELNMIAGRT